MGDLVSIASKWGVASIFRIVLPGLVLALLLLPLVNPLVPAMLKIDELTDLATILIPETLALGIFITLLRNVIYRIFEGRLLWPDWLHQGLTNRLQRRVEKRLSDSKELEQQSMKFKEIWYWLRLFPLDDNGDPIARRPTIFGNILEGYEEYPKRRYGMDSVFYWYRLWPTLPESFIAQADKASAAADCLTFISFSGVLVGSVTLALAVIKWAVSILAGYWPATFVTPAASLNAIPDHGLLALLGATFILGAFIIYRMSFPLHRTNGEFFKTAFDLYRNNIAQMTNLSLDEKTRWYQTWSYLQYMYVACPHCQQYSFSEEEKCPHCGKTRLGSENIASRLLSKMGIHRRKK